MIHRNGEAIAFRVRDDAADIVSVRKDHRLRGFDDALFAASLARAVHDDVDVPSIGCVPRSPCLSWQRHGFERYGDLDQRGGVTVRRIFGRTFVLPDPRPRVDVSTGFYSESATYERGDVGPIAEHRLHDARVDDGAILLERHVIGPCDVEPQRHDPTVRITIDCVQPTDSTMSTSM